MDKTLLKCSEKKGKLSTYIFMTSEQIPSVDEDQEENINFTYTYMYFIVPDTLDSKFWWYNHIHVYHVNQSKNNLN